MVDEPHWPAHQMGRAGRLWRRVVWRRGPASRRWRRRRGASTRGVATHFSAAAVSTPTLDCVFPAGAAMCPNLARKKCELIKTRCVSDTRALAVARVLQAKQEIVLHGLLHH